MITIDYNFPYFTLKPETVVHKYIAQAYNWVWDKTNEHYCHFDVKRVLPLTSNANVSDTAKEVIHKTLHSKAKKPIQPLSIPCPEGLSYFPYQEAGIHFMANTKRCLLGDEPGTGKTIQIAGLINYLNLKRVLIICPSGLRLNWVKELKKWSNIDAAPDVSEKHDVMCVSYDSLSHGGRFAKLRVMEFDLIALDECHYVKTPDTARTISTYSIISEAERVVFMSGTPIVNKPLEMYSMLNFLNPTYFYEENRFAHRYCRAFYKRVEWENWKGEKVSKMVLDKNGASNLIELNSILRGNYMLRRRKKDVLEQLPDKIWQVLEFSLSKQESKTIDSLEDEFLILTDDELEYVAARAAEAISEDKKMEDLIISKGFSISEFSKMRRLVGGLKIPYALDHVKNLLFSLDKIVIMCHHRDVVEAMVDGLSEYNPVKVMGGMSPKDKQASVDKFQNDPSVKVFVGNIQAAGVGITLTAASTIVFVEIVPVPGIMTQAEDRCVRIGATADNVLIQHIVLENSLDKRLCELIVKKQKVSDKILDGV